MHPETRRETARFLADIANKADDIANKADALRREIGAGPPEDVRIICDVVLDLDLKPRRASHFTRHLDGCSSLMDDDPLCDCGIGRLVQVRAAWRARIIEAEKARESTT